MTEQPKLTPTFTDQVSGLPGTKQPLAAYAGAYTNQASQVFAFPASRSGQVAFGPAGYLTGVPPQGAQQAKRERVAIVGTAPSSRMLAPVDDLTWDIWVCSPGNMETFKRVDAWFEIHANLHHPKFAESYGNNYIQWLSKQPFPVYLQDEEWHKKYFEHGIKFPAQELVAKFGRHFFTSSFAWMMALAIDRGYKEIGLFGVDMASKDEYIQQRQAFFYWLEKAQNLGIKVTIPPESDLMQPPGLYGYSDANRFGRKLHARGDELKGRSDQLAQQIAQTEAQLNNMRANKLYLDGALEDNDYTKSIWISLMNEWGDGSLQFQQLTAPPQTTAPAIPVPPPLPEMQVQSQPEPVKRKRGRPRKSATG